MKTIVLFLAVISNENNANPNLPLVKENLNGLHFAVTVNDSQLQNLEALRSVKDTMDADDIALFHSKNYFVTCRELNNWKNKGVQAEVKAYFNDEEIAMEDAYIFMDNRNTQEAKEYNEENKKRLKEIMAMNKNVNMFYSITISSKENEQAVKQLTKDYTYAIKTINENEMVVAGKFLTFQDVKEVYDQLVSNGAINISITACEFGNEIPVSNAVGKEQEYLQQLLAINEK